MKRVNAVVIGAGAAGGIVAKELSIAGLSVVLLERGKWYTANDCRKDDLRNQRTTVLGNAFGPEDEGNPRVWVDAKGAPHMRCPAKAAYQNNAACVGGGTLSYGAQAWRYMPQDFRMRSTYGAPPGSSLEDWPISYDDLEPFYEKAEYEIGVSGDYSGTPFMDRASARCRCRRCRPTASSKSWSLQRSGWGCIRFTFPWRATVCLTTGAARACAAGGACGFACEVDAKNGSQNTVIPVALNTGNCELRTECMVKEILTDDRGRARGVAYFDDGPLAGAAFRHRRGFRLRHGVRAPAAEFEKPAVSQRAGESLRPGRPQSARPPLHRRGGLLRLRDL